MPQKMKTGMEQDGIHLAGATYRIHRDYVTSLEQRWRLAADVDKDAVGGVHDKQAANGWIVESDLGAAEVDWETAAGLRRGKDVRLAHRVKNGERIGRGSAEQQAGSDEDKGPTSGRRLAPHRLGMTAKALGISHIDDCSHPQPPFRTRRKASYIRVYRRGFGKVLVQHVVAPPSDSLAT